MITEFSTQLLDFIQASPTPFHAVSNMAQQLQDAGFIQLHEHQTWTLSPQQAYYVIRNQSSIIAFSLGEDIDAGLRMIGAHTDSPCLKPKPNPEINSQNYFQLGVEVYGGALLNPWFDRDLSIAGRVSYSHNDKLTSALINFRRPIAIIPSLAIHLDREANKKRAIDPQKHLPPVLLQTQSAPNFRQLLLAQFQAEYPNQAIDQVIDYDLCFYDTQAPAIIGHKQDFIASARLDNLLSCYIGLQSLIQASSTPHVAHNLLVCNDHEEVGSQTACGAQGPFLKSVLQRLYPTPEDYYRAIDQSMLISADNAHGIHPNFTDRHDPQHGPQINQGPVIKTNANQRYASNGETSAIFRQLCQQVNVPVQAFVVRSDMACGSTIGPITAAEIGIRTLDIGVATFAMHSIRELAGCHDTHYLAQALTQFYQVPCLTDSRK